MFALPGIAALLVLVYARPQEFVPALQSAPLLYLAFALALVGLVVDLKLRLTQPRSAPSLPWVALWLGWCALTLWIRAPQALAGGVKELGITVILYYLVAHGIQSFRAFQAVAGTVLALVLFVSGVALVQGASPYGCVVIDETDRPDLAVGRPDGRACVDRRACYQGDVEPGAEYLCERIGPFGTTSIEGRVRYRGWLQDPNELGLAAAIALPFAFAFAEVRRSRRRRALAALALGAIALTVVLTKSRGALLVLLAALAVYFVRRFGWRGLVAGALAGAPLVLLGGRGGAEADESTTERLECWFEGMEMFRSHPILGVGQGQFTEYHYLTAHNSYILAAAELGLVGLALWIAALYVSGKVLLTALRRYDGVPEAAVARSWATALLASLAGLLVGVFFLSFCYHFVLWTYLGLFGAFYAACKGHDPGLRVRLGLVDLVAVVAICVAIVAGLLVFTRLRAP